MTKEFLTGLFYISALGLFISMVSLPVLSISASNTGVPTSKTVVRSILVGILLFVAILIFCGIRLEMFK